MKSFVNLGAGGAFVAILKSIPAFVKVPVIAGAVMLAAIELNKDANKSWFSGHIFGGQAADGEAKSADPVDARNAMNAGKKVSGAERLVTVQYEAGDADARQKEATADAALESEQEILDKKAKGAKLTSTEELRLKEMEIKRQELAIKTAEARLKTAEATNAEQEAAVQKLLNNMILSAGNGGNAAAFANKMRVDADRRVSGAGLKPARKMTERKTLENTP